VIEPLKFPKFIKEAQVDNYHGERFQIIQHTTEHTEQYKLILEAGPYARDLYKLWLYKRNEYLTNAKLCDQIESSAYIDLGCGYCCFRLNRVLEFFEALR
jgi:hypothetical protein